MTSLTFPAASRPHDNTDSDTRRRDLMRLVLLLMLFLNVSLAAMLLAPDDDRRAVSQSSWHGNAVGTALE